jgi:hypothetical protein
MSSTKQSETRAGLDDCLKLVGILRFGAFLQMACVATRGASGLRRLQRRFGVWIKSADESAQSKRSAPLHQSGQSSAA